MSPAQKPPAATPAPTPAEDAGAALGAHPSGGPAAREEHPGVALRRSFGAHAIRLGEMVFARAEAALAPLALTPLAYDAMVCILEGHGMSQQDLSRRLGIYAPKMVGVLDGLQQQGLVERQVSAADRRRHELRLTPAGHARLEAATAVAVGLERALFGDVPADGKAWMAALVARLEAEAGDAD
ncbi:MarR family winged helix-turn-helix transcriptional regulator [Caulobacter sp. KR2-114]|uniref:MarR family winged helix-turn-helix transcriptional regulator n=1 Tax=Caulobacter sp. KR2-114 TaxID=3400912 RepID=UPI003C030214